MPVTIGEIITETLLAPAPDVPPTPGEPRTDTDTELIVRRATERVLEVLRREWDG